MLDWGLTAAAVLVLLFAVRVLFTSGRAGNAGREKLGCGFAVLAALLWTYVLQRHIGSTLPAVRLGLAVLLLLPAVSALANPGGARILRAVIGVIVASVLAGPVLEDLWSEYGPDTRSPETRRIADRRAELEELRAELAGRRADYRSVEEEALAAVRARGGDWAAIESDAEALRQLELLDAAREKRVRVEEALGRVEDSLRQLDEAEARASSASKGVLEKSDEVELLRESLERDLDTRERGIVEEHLRRSRLRELFEAGADAGRND